MRDSLPVDNASAGRPFAIRQATPEDLAAVLALVEGSDEVPRWTAAAWAAYLASEPENNLHHVLFLCRTSDGVVDSVLAATLLERVTELELVYVHPRVRKQGRAMALTRSWLAWGRENKASEAWLEVRASNAAALALYQTAGFAEQSRRKAYYRDPVEDAIVMQRTF